MAGIIAAPLTQLSVELEPIQLVAPDGTPTTETRYRRDLPPETLAWLYESMVVTRQLDTEFVNLQRQGELALFASCRGQEAAQIGAAACLRKTDWLFPQYRELGVFMVRGITPSQMGAVWRGRSDDELAAFAAAFLGRGPGSGGSTRRSCVLTR